MIVPDVKPILNPYLAMTSEKYLKEVTVGPVSALSGKVVLEEYDAAWKGIFKEEKDACETMPRILIGRHTALQCREERDCTGYEDVRCPLICLTERLLHPHGPSVAEASAWRQG